MRGYWRVAFRAVRVNDARKLAICFRWSAFLGSAAAREEKRGSAEEAKLVGDADHEWRQSVWPVIRIASSPTACTCIGPVRK